MLRKAFVDAYDRLAHDTPKSQGFDGKPVRKVSVDAIREELKNRGFLETDEKGNVTGASRKSLLRAKTELLSRHSFAEADKTVWRT